MASKKIIEVWEASKYQIHLTQSGELTSDDFNRQLKLAELRMLGWLTGNPDAKQQSPTPYDNQKSRDWLTPLIKKDPQNVVDGKIDRPADYYQYENMYVLELVQCDCDDDCEEAKEKVVRWPIDLLQGQQFQVRAITDIKLLKPSVKKPIAKQVGNNFQFLPEDLGSVELEYISYPDQYGKLVMKIDPVYNEEIPDENASIDIIWGDWSVEVLTWFIVNNFADRTRDVPLKNMNTATGKLAL